jgi:hypothetical protein
VSFAAINVCVASQRVFVVVVVVVVVFVVYSVIDSVRKLLDTPSYVTFTQVEGHCQGKLGERSSGLLIIA